MERPTVLENLPMSLMFSRIERLSAKTKLSPRSIISRTDSGREEAACDFDHAVNLLLGHFGEKRQREDFAANAFRDREVAFDIAQIFITRLEMTRNRVMNHATDV